MAAKKSDPKQYTQPELREKIKKEVIAGDKGGRPGQWSARKAQMVAHEYEAEGGGYKHEKTEAQTSLTEWGEEHWTTEDGKKAVRGKETARYLPEKAWKELSPEERKATEERKRKGSREGKQFVGNTKEANKARKHAEVHDAAPGRKAAEKKAPAKKAAAAKGVSAKKAAAKEAPAKKAAAAKGASAKKASAKKTPARKAVAAKGASAKKAGAKTPARKAPAKKAAAAKRTAKKGSAK
jgi:hypothetical protein